jgi:ATP-dependent Clp protease adaptor protein ClpS
MDSQSRAVPEKIEKEEEQTDEGPLYRVIIHNDDITPMEFVIDILIAIFMLPITNAAYIMYTAHLNGSAYVQTLPKPEAQRRINKAHFAARLKGYPLQFTMEPE